MSIDPVQGFGPISEVGLGEGQPRVWEVQSSPSSGADSSTESSPNVGRLPKEESSGTNNTSAVAEFPEDEVQLQQDTEIRDQVIVRYLDKATGDVVLQVPSTQVLSVARGIYEDFQKQAETTPSGTKVRP